MNVLGFDIGAALTPDVSLFETVVRGVVMYLVILVLMRYLLRGRTTASMPDLLVIVLIADAAQNAMSAEYSSIANGITLVATIIGMSTLLDFLGQRNAAIGRFIHPDRRPLIIDGRMIRKTMASELISEEELLTQLRLQGTESVADVKAAYLEGTGEVSVIKREKAGGEAGKKRGPGAK